MYDVYLGGTTTPEWRKAFTSQISTDILVFDPFVKDTTKWTKKEKAEQIAREFYFMDQCDIIVFYFSSEISKSARVQLGDAVGRGKQVVVYLDKKVVGKKFLQHYCEYRGVLITTSMEELVAAVEEYASELELCQFDAQKTPQ